MKIFIKTLTLLVTSLFIASFVMISASADTTALDGVIATATANEKRYADNDTAKITVELNNMGTADIESIIVKAVLPDGLKSSETEKRLDLLTKDSKETFTFEISKNVLSAPVSVQASNVQPTDTAKTGDISNVLYISAVLIVSVALVILCRKKKCTRQVLSILLCVMIAVSAPVVPANAEQSDPLPKTLNTKETITFGSTEYNIDLTISYICKLEPEKSKLSVNTDDVSSIKDDNGNIYLADKADTLSGTLTNAQGKTLSYTIRDDKGTLLCSGTKEASENWSFDNLGFTIGKNILTVTASDGKTSDSFTTVIQNQCNENMHNIIVDTSDDDSDGLNNYLEAYYGTDKTNPDCDGDGLNDYYELAVLGTDPLSKNTDGVNDADEDFDSDGFTNLQEFEYGTEPFLADCDFDGLSDFDELNKYNTNPCNADNDSDGMEDGMEIEAGTNPLSFDAEFSRKITSSEIPGISSSLSVSNASGNIASKISLIKSTDKADAYYDNDVPGYLGCAIEAYADTDATLSFDVDENLLNASSKLAVYYYDEENQILSEVTDATVSENTICANISKGGKYLVIDNGKYENNKTRYTRKGAALQIPLKSGVTGTNDFDGDGLLNNEDSEPYVWNVCDRDLLFFASLAYEKYSNFITKNIIGNSNEDGNSYYCYDFGNTNEVTDRWSIVEYTSESTGWKTTFSSSVYKNGQNVVLAFRGTDGEIGEWINNILSYGFANNHSEETFCRKWTSKMAKKYAQYNLYLAGHSLGGYLTQISACQIYEDNLINSVKRISYFNGMGIKLNALLFWTKSEEEDDLKAINKLGILTAYRITGDIVSGFGTHYGQVVLFDPRPSCIENQIARNSADYMAKLWYTHETDSFFYYLTQGVRKP